MVFHISTERFPGTDCGRGSPILFVHGAACDHRIWGPHIQKLSRLYRCIAPTLRWFGSTPWRPTDLEFNEKTHANDMASIVDRLDCGTVFVVGWSYGANIALRLAFDRPDLVSGIAVYEPSATSLISSPMEIITHQLQMQETFVPVTEAASTGNAFEVLRAFVETVGGLGTFENLPPEFHQICQENAHTLIPLLNSKHRINSVTAAELATLSMPIHIAWGDRSGDVWTIPSKAAAGLANTQGYNIPGANHVWPAHDPAAFLLWLQRVLDHDADPLPFPAAAIG